jgi:DNA-binding NtrC family response regulator
MFQIRLLVVDNSKGLQSYVRQLFETFGFDPNLIRSASKPDNALEISKDLKPDFLLTDWFPNEELTGIRLHQEIVAYSPDCRFAMLSTDVGSERLELAKRAGAIFLMIKPCSAVDLRAALGKALQQLSAEVPRINGHVGEMTAAAARHLAALKLAERSNHFGPGDKVQYKGRTDTVLNVIFRHGDMVVQLHGVTGMVPASQVLKV